MTKKYRYYIYAILIYILALGAHAYGEYKDERKILYESIDKDLIQGARSVSILLKDNFHDQTLDKESISYDEDMQNIRKLSEFTKLTRLVYIYSYILDNDTVRFTSSSATPEELKSNTGISHYFDTYESATIKLREAFTQESIVFENINDQWGTFRSVYITSKTKSGKVYVTGADIKIDFIDNKLYELLFNTLLEALILLSILIPFFLAFRFINIKAKEELEETIRIRTEELNRGNLQLLEYKKAVDASAIVSKSDPTGRITYVNDAFCEISGFDRSELIGKSHNIVRSPDVEKSFYADMWNTIQSKDIFKGIVKNMKKDGSFYYVATTIVPILNPYGEISEYLSLRYEITELVHAKEKAQIAEKAKSTFLANMSHEIRTPLNAIIGFSDILCESNLNSDAKEYAQIVAKSAKSLLYIINDVLDISKIESGKLEIVNKPFLFNAFTENIVELFSLSAKEKNIRFIYNSDARLPHSVIADEIRLQQILSNLLSNAIKFTPEEGKISLSIDVLEISQENAKIKFSVVDSGIGMSPDQQKIVFNPFSQADDGISRKYGGSGLGLSICSDIAKLMHSKIALKSEIDMGSEFSFIIDLKVDILENSISSGQSNLIFALCNSQNDVENLKTSVQNYLKQIGTVYDLHEKCNKKVDMLFCFGGDELIQKLQEFQSFNAHSTIVYVGNQKKISDVRLKEYVNYYLDLPIYGSKIFNIIADNSKIHEQVIESAVLSEHTIEANILVAEDNPNNQKLIEILLNKIGVSHTIVNNGLEALDAYQNSKFDMVLMDINMPKLDGVEATKELIRLQKENALYKIPIIALTANSISGDREGYLEAGMDDYLSKPIEFEKLVTIIKKYLHNKSFEGLQHLTTQTQELQVEKASQEEIVYKKSDAMKQLGLDELTVDMLLDNFFLTLDDDLNKLKKAVDSKDCDAIYKAAHYIKGSCSNLAMHEPQSMLHEIENNAKNGICNQIHLEKIVRSFEMIRQS